MLLDWVLSEYNEKVMGAGGFYSYEGVIEQSDGKLVEQRKTTQQSLVNAWSGLRFAVAFCS